jgi:hypothetical protein
MSPQLLLLLLVVMTIRTATAVSVKPMVITGTVLRELRNHRPLPLVAALMAKRVASASPMGTIGIAPRASKSLRPLHRQMAHPRMKVAVSVRPMVITGTAPRASRSLLHLRQMEVRLERRARSV